LNPESLSARLNQLYNSRRREGELARLDPSSVEAQLHRVFARYEAWREVLSICGPVDEPTSLYKTATVLQEGGNTIQAIQSLDRASILAPDWPAPRLLTARILLPQGRSEEALAALSPLGGARTASLTSSEAAEYLCYHVVALRNLNRSDEASNEIRRVLAERPKSLEVNDAVSFLYQTGGRLEESLVLLNDLLEADPGRVDWLARKGVVLLQLGRLGDAVAVLTEALTLAPSAPAPRLHRAVALLGSGKLEAAREDYEALLPWRAFKQRALFGLGEIAWREHKTNEVVHYYQEYLSNGNEGSAQTEIASQRLRLLEPGL
jgi:tetratricopeptide (TPR) repeat protein